MATKVKICGLTTVEDAAMAISEGADAIGLNFYANSKRYLEINQAKEIFQKITSEKILVVGVFVNEKVSKIKNILKNLPLDALQFHGEESPEVCAEFKDKLLIKAFRIGDDFDYEVLTKYQDVVDYFLIDTFSKEAYGGTGKQLTVDLLANYPKKLWSKTILAGGLTPENVAEKIEKYQPYAVDVASGVEDVSGKKDPNLIRQFVKEVRKANYNEVSGN